MWHLLEKIRAKPVNVRKRILFVTAASLTLVIFIVWVSTFISAISQATADDKGINKSTFSFLNTFKNAVIDIFETANKKTNTYQREQPIIIEE